MDDETQNQTGKGSLPYGTMKLIASPTHVGPVPKKQSGSQSRLSAAANKIRLNNNLKVVAGSEAESGKPKKASKTKKLDITLKEGDAGLSVANATILVEAWDRLYRDIGTADYIEKANTLEKARLSAYAALGIPYAPGSSRPELTEEQKVAYNAMVLPYAFQYWEVRLSFKQPGQKAVRTKTYRMLKEPNLESVFKQVRQKAVSVAKDLMIEARPSN